MREVNLRGEPFYIHDKEDISDAIIRDKDYFENHILDYVKKLYPKQSTIVDVGAMIGNHSHYFARFFEHKSIVAFEPILENYSLLELNVKSFPTITIHKTALSNFTGVLTMGKHKGNWGMHMVIDPEVTELEELESVVCTTLDSYNLQDVTLLKIDVEYYEPLMLEGATETIARCQPIILIEDVDQTYMNLPQMQGYSLVKSWVPNFTYLYVAKGT